METSTSKSPATAAQAANAKARSVRAKTLRVGLLWHSANSGNLGVGALTVANIALAREVAAEMGIHLRFTIIGMRDQGPRYVCEADAAVFDVNTLSLAPPGGCWAQFGNLDCILDIGGGDSFADIYGLKRFIFIWFTKVLALARRKPLLLSPQTIGPFTRQPYRFLAQSVLKHARGVIARDTMSFEALKELAPSAPRLQSVDVAFALPYVDQRQPLTNRPVRVGVNVSGLMFNEAVSGRNGFSLNYDYAELMRRFVGDLVKRPQFEVHLLTHVVEPRSQWEDDSRVADAFAEAFPGAVRAPDFASPSEAKSYISGLDFLVAGRMHACIAAYSVGTPLVPIAYSRKFTGLFGMLKYPWLVPATGLDTEQALEFLMSCVEQRDRLSASIREGSDIVSGLLVVYRAALRDFFAAAAGG